MALPQKRHWLRGFYAAYFLPMACWMEWVAMTIPDAQAAVIFAGLATMSLMVSFMSLAAVMKTSPDEERPAWSFGLGHALLAMSIFAGSLGMRAAWGG